MDQNSYNQLSTEFCVVIITYNPVLDYVEKNLLKLAKNGICTILVDNGSSNQSQLGSLISKLNITSEIKFLTLNYNSGLGTATNYGFKFAVNSAYNYVFLFDQDTDIRINYLLDAFNALKEVESMTNRPSIMSALCVNKANETKKKISTASFDLTELKNSIASCTLVNLEVYNSIGGQLEQLFIDHVDTEWFFRALNFGYKIYSISGEYTTHKIGDFKISFLGRSYNVHSPLRIYYRTRNTLYLLKLPYIPLSWKLKSSFTMIYRAFLFSLKIKFKRKAYINAFLRGILHGINFK
jgi:rhamnosyltransferase